MAGALLTWIYNALECKVKSFKFSSGTQKIGDHTMFLELFT